MKILFDKKEAARQMMAVRSVGAVTLRKDNGRINPVKLQLTDMRIAKTT
jgi:hypothetical protein